MRLPLTWLVLCLSLVLLMGTSASAQTTKRAAVLITALASAPTPVVTASTARAVLFTLAGSVNGWYREASYGQWSITGRLRADGDVFGPYVLDSALTCATGYAQWAAMAGQRAALEGYVATNYDVVVVVLPAVAGCPNRAWTSGRFVYVRSGVNVETLVHEFGHAFGLVHATGARCYTLVNSARVYQPLSDTCSVDEYGDFAVMGTTGSAHMNGFHKAALGWLMPQTVTPGTTVTLTPIETTPSVVRVQQSIDVYGRPVYVYLEFRQPIGFDAHLTVANAGGVLLHLAPESTWRSLRPKLLDAHPLTPVGGAPFSDAALHMGESVTLASTHVTMSDGTVRTFPPLTIAILSVTTTEAIVRIE